MGQGTQCVKGLQVGLPWTHVECESDIVAVWMFWCLGAPLEFQFQYMLLITSGTGCGCIQRLSIIYLRVLGNLRVIIFKKLSHIIV